MLPVGDEYTSGVSLTLTEDLVYEVDRSAVSQITFAARSAEYI